MDPATGELLFSRDTMLRNEDAKVLEAHGIHSAKIRSVLTCEGTQRRVRQVLRHQPGHR